MTATKDKMKQRSFYMDDETYALIEAHAARLGTSNGTALRMLVRHELLDAPAEPVSQRDTPPAGHRVDAGTGRVKPLEDSDWPDNKPQITLPPDNQETFAVPPKFRDRGGPASLRTPDIVDADMAADVVEARRDRGGPPRPKHEDDDF